MRSGHKTAGSHTSSRHDASRYHRGTDSKRQSPGFLFLRKPIPTDYEIRICRTNTNEDGFPDVFSPIPQNKRTLKNKEIQRGASGIRTVLTKVLTVFSKVLRVFPKVPTVFPKVPTVFPKVLIVFFFGTDCRSFPATTKIRRADRHFLRTRTSPQHHPLFLCSRCRAFPYFIRTKRQPVK